MSKYLFQFRNKNIQLEDLFFPKKALKASEHLAAFLIQGKVLLNKLKNNVFEIKYKVVINPIKKL